jgi:hypothetical protein
MVEYTRAGARASGYGDERYLSYTVTNVRIRVGINVGDPNKSWPARAMISNGYGDLRTSASASPTWAT